MSENEDLITALEASRILGVAPRTVSKYRQEGRIPFVRYSPKMYRYRRMDIVLFVKTSYQNTQLTLF